MTGQVRKKIRLGDLLVEHKAISEEQLMQALADQKKSGRKLGKVLIENGFIDEDSMLDILSHQLRIPFIDLKYYKYDADTVRLLPETHARRYRAIPLDSSGDDVLVGMADPTDIFGYDEISNILKRPIRQALVRETDLLSTIDSVFRRTQEISEFAEELGEELSDNDFDIAALGEAADVADAPVVKLLQSMFEDAAQVGASDIHIEPDEHVLRLRQRIDGILHETVMKEKRIATALVSRLKLMSGLNISERRLPQDGRFNIKVKDKSIDVRLSTMPVQYGESVVMRLLDQSHGMLDLNQLGMPEDIATRFKQIIRQPHGMALVTGPTGSGKTTTLYAALNLLNHPENKIITVEDPVEYRLPRINQVQVNPAINLTFARVLRAALRQDPDIVLVGEMRDHETVEMGLRAAMTGHLVLSTLHTNDAVSTALRLLDMGAEGFLVASALQAVLAQRLIRRICESCVEDYTPQTHEWAWAQQLIGDRTDTVQFKHGAGCPHCNNTGYRGRIGVYELLEINNNLADALRRNDAAGFTRAAQNQKNFRTLAQTAMDKAEAGITTIEEVMRIAGDVNTDAEEFELPLSPIEAATGVSGA
ncbi:GspE/PulE family protein [Sulfuriflexus sp.]|uniref:GspE/PulE family protein n=1 Tax=Sulfuriflexus sp. TaxID=2015443 RepID=UPI0028CD5337|nr:GspE/PulE family protein [Sulfuriflexus sp.]MDT8404415.1 GspE/PulE family protein [Sulfuriflexus sp.]